MYDVHTASVLPFLLGGTTFSPKFSKGCRRKITVCGNLKSFCHVEYLPGDLLCFLSKKRLSKIKHGFEFSVSNVDLGLF